ncbi:unnamed protein product, partial [Rotaria sp. Silwood1]
IIQLSVDLDKTAHKLISLLEKTSKFRNQWRKSVILQQMIRRYYRFMILKSLYPKIYLVPTIDIEIVWQTHLLRPGIYRDDCHQLFNKIIDHSLLLNQIQQSFFHTSYLYEKHFDEEYCSLPLYKNAKTTSSKYIHPYFNKIQYLTETYSYWDKTLFQFSKYSPDDYENPFSFRRHDIILDGKWIHSCQYFMDDMLTMVPNDIWSFNVLNPINLKSSEMKRLKKSYERFLYIITKYSITKQYHFIHPTYASETSTTTTTSPLTSTSTSTLSPLTTMTLTTASTITTITAQQSGWSNTGNMSIVGGYNLDDGYLNSSELYDPSTGTWTATGNMHIDRYHHTSSVLPDGKVLVAGRFRHGSWINSSELYDPLLGNRSVTGSMYYKREWHTASVLANGTVLVTGGYDGNAIPDSAELYNPSTGNWTLTGYMNEPRSDHTASVLTNGKVLVTGGCYGDCGNSTEL